MKNTTFRQSLRFAVPMLAMLGLCSAPALAGGDKATLKRGAYLVGYGGCADCHMPFKMGPAGPEKDTARGLSGHPDNLQLPAPPKLDNEWNWAGAAPMTAFSGPWGISYSANLTPDRETGIGSWTEKDFIKVMKTGQHVSGRPIMPPMPWQSVAVLSERDLRAIFAYLMAQPAVKNKVAEYQPPIAAR
jgi:hypothetical protein